GHVALPRRRFSAHSHSLIFIPLTIKKPSTKHHQHILTIYFYLTKIISLSTAPPKSGAPRIKSSVWLINLSILPDKFSGMMLDISSSSQPESIMSIKFLECDAAFNVFDVDGLNIKPSASSIDIAFFQ
ncbi:hypothetical protein, partial [Escherichia coli]